MSNDNGGPPLAAARPHSRSTAAAPRQQRTITFGGKTFSRRLTRQRFLFVRSTNSGFQQNRLILKDAFGYDIVMPETFGTFYAQVNETTGLLTVRGG